MRALYNDMDASTLDIIFEALGIVGVVLILIAYFFMQAGKLTMLSMGYQLLNLVGAILLLCSLMRKWNTPSVIIECCWIAISIYGIVRIIRMKRKGPPDAE